METGFGSGIGECLERGDAQAVDAANVDDTCWGARGRSGFEEGCDSLSKLEDAFEVQV